MNSTLGIYGLFDKFQGYYHNDFINQNASASFWLDGKHKYTIEEEKISRNKRDFIIDNSIDYVLEEYNKDNIKEICFVNNNYSKEVLKQNYKIIKNNFPKSNVYLFDHILCHVYSSFYTSKFSESIVLIDEAFGKERNFLCSIDNKINKINKNKDFICEISYANFIISLLVYCNRYSFYDIKNKSDFLLEHRSKIDEMNELSFYQCEKLYNIDNKEEDLKKIKKLKDLFYFEDKSSIQCYINSPYNKIIMDNVIDARTNKILYRELFDDINEYSVMYWLNNQYTYFFIEILKRIKNKYGFENLCINGDIIKNYRCLNLVLESNVFENIHCFPTKNDRDLSFGAVFAKNISNKDFDFLSFSKRTGKKYTDTKIEDIIENENKNKKDQKR